MKKILFSIVVVLMLIKTLVAQDIEKQYEYGAYTIYYSDSFVGVQEVALGLTSLRLQFDSIFKFDSSPLNGSSKVRILPDKASFDEYVTERLGETRNQFLYLKYSTPEASELVLYPIHSGKTGFQSISGITLLRQLFLQYIYSHLREPPLWIRDGFQAWFENSNYDTEAAKSSNNESLAWLESAKILQRDTQRSLSIDQILAAQTGMYDSSRLYPQAWALVSFFMKSENPEYQRFLYESFILLKKDTMYSSISQAMSTEMIFLRFSKMFDVQAVNEDFQRWLSIQYSYADLLTMGIQAYNSGNYAEAKKRLESAMFFKSEDPMLLYYMGLILYSQKEYSLASEWYKKALLYGSEAGTVNWALALAAYAQGKNEETLLYLETAKTANPLRYKERVDSLIQSIQGR